MTRILLVDNYDSFTYNLAQMLSELPGVALVVQKNDRISLRKVNDFDKILFSPGPDLPRQAPVMFDLLDRFGSSKSILGVCLGHQAIAEFFGGSLYQQSEVMHGMTRLVHFQQPRDLLFKSLPEKIAVGLYHSWAVSASSLPACLEVTATSEDGVVMALRHRALDIRGIQFHLESYMTPFGKTMLGAWVEG
jgi:anthranilate synthase/aminodeoxychorismate synthase-like glutamine amidotransferase